MLHHKIDARVRWGGGGGEDKEPRFRLFFLFPHLPNFTTNFRVHIVRLLQKTACRLLRPMQTYFFIRYLENPSLHHKIEVCEVGEKKNEPDSLNCDKTCDREGFFLPISCEHRCYGVASRFTRFSMKTKSVFPGLTNFCNNPWLFSSPPL